MTLAELTLFPSTIPILPLLLGTVMLLFGRRLFWLFVGTIGFLAGAEWGAVLLGPQPDGIALAFAVIAGVICALLALLLQRLAIALAGGVVGGAFGVGLAASMGWTGGNSASLAFLVGALLAALLATLLFDSALIILSSLAGGMMLAHVVASARRLEIVIALILCLIGIIFQRRGRITNQKPPVRW